MIAIKLKYTASAEFHEYLHTLRKEQSIVYRSAYNRFCENKSENEATAFIRTLKNIDSICTWIKHCGVMQAKAEVKSALSRNLDPTKVIFGTRYNYNRLCEGLITKQEFKNKRLRPLYVTGEANVRGNRKFKLNIDNSVLEFRDRCGKVKFNLILNLPKREQLKQLKYIENAARLKQKPLTVRIDENHVSLIFEPERKPLQQQISDRVFAIDTNPNQIGWSVSDVHETGITVIESGIINFKELNSIDNKLKNKKHYEIYQICKRLVDQAVQYKCSKFAIEEINIKRKDHNKGKKYNRTVNNKWNRGILFRNIEKRCFINNIEVIKINPAYTSIIGATLYRGYPDPISPTFEIARRAIHKYQKDKFYPEIPSVKRLNEQWKQTLDTSFESWKELSDWLKNTKFTYRVSLKDSFKFLSLFHPRSCVLQYSSYK